MKQSINSQEKTSKSSESTTTLAEVVNSSTEQSDTKINQEKIPENKTPLCLINELVRFNKVRLIKEINLA